MDFRVKTFVSLLLLMLVVFGLYFFSDWFSKVTGYVTGDDEKIKLVKCMNEKDAEFYTGVYCADCERQEKEFGETIEKLNKIVCETSSTGVIIDERRKSLRSIPAWYANGKIEYGYKSLEELKQLYGC